MNKVIEINTKKVKAKFEVSAREVIRSHWDNGNKTVKEIQLDGTRVYDHTITINGIEYTCYFTSKLVTLRYKRVKNPNSKHSWDKIITIDCYPYETAQVIIENLRRVNGWNGKKFVDPAPNAYNTLVEALRPFCLELLRDVNFINAGKIEQEEENLARLKKDLILAQDSVMALEKQIKDQEERLNNLKLQTV